MDDVHLIDFDEVALNRGGGDDDDDSLLIADINDADILSQPSMDAATLTQSPSPDDASSRCSSATPPPHSDEADVPVDRAAVVDDLRPPLPPAAAILPPLRPQSSDLPEPEVSTGDSPSDDSRVARRYNGRASMGIGASQLVVGVSCVALGIAAAVTGVHYSAIGSGIWAGTMCFICGLTGIQAYRMKTSLRIALYMSASVMSVGCSIAVFVVSTLACADAELVTHESCRKSNICSATQVTASLIINLMLCVVSMVDLTVCMSSLALTIRAFCRPNCCSCDCCHSSPSNNVDTFPWLCMYDSGSSTDPNLEIGSDFRLCRQPPPYSPAESPPPYAPGGPDDRGK